MIETLHALRFVFLMLIVFSHIIGSRFDFGGECGVSFFFMLSGFVLSYAYGAKVEQGQFETVAFVKRQLLKFYPLHLLAQLAVVLLDARLGHFYDWQHLVPSILLLQSWIPLDEYYFVANGLSWFLCDILFFYLLFNTVCRWLNRLSLTGLGMLSVLVGIAYLTLAFLIPMESVNSILYAAPWTRLIDFCLGILLCRFYKSAQGRLWTKRLTECDATRWEVLAVALLTGSFFVYEVLTPRLRCVALFWSVIPPLLLLFAFADRGHGRVTRCLKLPLFQWLGSITLEIYLLHMLVFRLANSLLLSAGLVRGWQVIACELILMILVAWLAKRFFVDKIYASLKKYVL